jgi:hypothetical protein
VTADLSAGQLVRGCPLGQRRRQTGTVIRVDAGWIVFVRTLPDRNDHVRTVLMDAAAVEVLG